MGRNYPRFLFSDPQNTKSPGPFIVHTLFPRGILTIKKDGPAKGWSDYTVYFIELFDEATIMEQQKVETAAAEWVYNQLRSGDIVMNPSNF